MTENDAREGHPRDLCRAGWQTQRSCPHPATAYIIDHYPVCEGHRRVFELGRQVDAYALALDILGDVTAYARAFEDQGEVLLELLEEPRSRTGSRAVEDIPVVVTDRAGALSRAPVLFAQFVTI